MDKQMNIMPAVLALMMGTMAAAQAASLTAIHVHVSSDAVQVVRPVDRDVLPVPERNSILIRDNLNGTYVTQEDLVFHIQDDDFPNALIVIPKGFTTDFGSIPQPFRCIIEGIGTDRDLVYLLHDWVYATEYFAWSGVTYKEIQQARPNREECDELLLMGCKAVGDSWLIRNTIWVAVRFGGGFVWSDHTIESVAGNRALLAPRPAK